MKSHYKNDYIEFKYLINTNYEINPIFEIYRSKLFYNIQNFFINCQVKKFGYKSFQKKKNFSRTLTGIFSSWSHGAHTVHRARPNPIRTQP